jgi:Papain family cysteine protease
MIKSLVDLRGNFGPARDQNPRPTCLAFAASDAHAAVRPGWEPLSAEWAYYCALKRGGGHPDNGATLGGMLEAIKLDGQPAEAEWPYIKVPITDIASWKPPAPASKLFYRDHGACAVTVQDVIGQLNASRPVLFTMTLSNAFYRPSPEGVVDEIEPVDPKRRHAVVAIGHGERRSSRFVLIRNSWGEAWGLQGYAWVSVDYLAPRLTGAAIMTAEL